MDFETEKVKNYPFETTSVGGKTYNVELLRQTSEHIPVRDVPIETLSGAVGEGNYYWIDDKGNKLGPFQILADWDAAKKNQDWHSHVETIERADMDKPIWITQDGQVFDGMHRLTRAFVDNVPMVKAKVFDSLPIEAVVE